MTVESFVYKLECGQHEPFVFDVFVEQTLNKTGYTVRAQHIRVVPRGPMRMTAINMALGAHGLRCECSGALNALTNHRGPVFSPIEGADRLIDLIRAQRNLRRLMRPVPWESSVKQDRNARIATILIRVATRIFERCVVVPKNNKDSVSFEINGQHLSVNRNAAFLAMRHRLHLAVPGWWCRYLSLDAHAAFTKIKDTHGLQHVNIGLKLDAQNRWTIPTAAQLEERLR